MAAVLQYVPRTCGVDVSVGLRHVRQRVASNAVNRRKTEAPARPLRD